MRETLKNNKLLIMLVFIDLTMAILVVVLAVMAWQKSAKIVDLTQQANQLNQKQSGLASLKSATVDSRTVMAALWLDDKTKAAVIDQLEELGVKAGVEYVLTNVKESANDLEYQATVKGNFADVYYFMSLIENLPYQIRIKSASLEKGLIAKSQNSLWSASLIISLTNLGATGN